MYTLVIASYKYGHLAAQAIESGLCQNFPFDRILFVDDGAGDCTHLQELYPEVEFVLREENFGTVANFQDMLNRIDTGYAMFLGADNYLRPDTLQKCAMNLADIVSYDINLFGTEVLKFRQLVPYNERDGYSIWPNALHGSSLYNVEKAKKFGYKRNPNSVKTEEDKMLFEAMLADGATRNHVSEPLLYYRRHKKNFQ